MKSFKKMIISVTLVMAFVLGYFHVLSNWAVGVCAEEPDSTQSGISTSVEQSTSNETTAPEETTQPSTSATPYDTTQPTTSTTPSEPSDESTTSTNPTTGESTGPIAYSVVFRNWDGSVISMATYYIGETIAVPDVPPRPDADGYRYFFSGWDKEVATICTADAEYTAQYTSEKLPKSSDNTLKSLSITNATLTPAFNPGITNYTANVPFSVNKLNLTPTANHSKARVKLTNPTLVAGGKTKVVITVTAENGSIKTYNIDVTRAADPNYVLSSNNNLSDIRVGGYVLSPAFNPDITDYVIWLPYETASVSLTGLTADSKATARTEGGRNLVAGADNEIKVICTAENGEEKVYTVIAKRAAAHGDAPTQPTDQPTTAPIVDPTVAPTQPSTLPATHVCQPNGVAAIWVVIPWTLFAVAAIVIVVLLIQRNKKK